MSDTDSPLSAEELEERAAIDFLERLVADRGARRNTTLAEYLARFPRFEARIASEWLLATGSLPAAAAEPAPSEGRSTEQHIGNYRLVRELGRGGQGTVYLAEDPRAGRTVALKVLARGLHALDSQAYLRLQREAHALARLDHPGVATVYEVGETADIAWIAMRFVDGGSLQQLNASRLARGQGPPRTPAEITTLLRLAERAARALHAAHAAGILHRDVKPANILLAGAEQPVLVDFGLAQDERSDTPTLTLPGQVLGTLCYLPPERLAGAAADVRADVYGLGAALYEALTLARPYQAATTAAELHAIANEALRDVRSRNPAVSKDLALVVATALAKDPASRYQTAAALADDLDRLLEKRPIRARPPTALDTLVSFCQRDRALAVSLGAVFGLLLAGLVTVTWLWRDNRKALAAVSRLADLKLARELRQREVDLWPARPERIAAMRAWLDDAHRLGERIPVHAALLAALPPPGTGETTDWQRDQLEALQRELADFDQRVAGVERRVQRSAALPALSLEQPAAAWAQTRGRILAHPSYGFDLAPQLGLIPLGPDPHSGLEEFAHLASGAAAQRDPQSGSLVFGEDSGVVLILVPGGQALLGADRTPPEPARPANIDPQAPAEQTPSYVVPLEPYFLSKWELTQAQWLRHTGQNPATYQPGTGLTKVEGLLHPVELVTWVETDRVLRELDLQVPTEAQWERAYRTGRSTPYPYGEEARSLAGHENLADRTARDRGMNRQLSFIEWLEDGHMVHAPVGCFAPNGYGFFDMGGNVKEWCADSWENYNAVPPRPGDGLRRGEFERYRIVRGGCFSSAADEARAAARYAGEKDTRGAEAGVRPARRIER